MAVDDVRIRARKRLEELIGVEEAAFVVGDRPPGGWDSLVTKEHLALELNALRHEVLGALHEELRAQTWRLTTALLATVTIITAVITTVLRVT
jgi:hypothetical protein